MKLETEGMRSTYDLIVLTTAYVDPLKWQNYQTFGNIEHAIHSYYEWTMYSELVMLTRTTGRFTHLTLSM